MRLEEGNIKLLDPKETTLSLIPDSGIQFLDYLVDTAKCKSLKFHFLDLEQEINSSETSSTIKQFVHPVQTNTNEDEQSYREETYSSIYSDGPKDVVDNVYQVSPKNAFEVFDRQWLPIPYFRLTSVSDVYDNGPTNWARVYLAKPLESDPPNSPYRMIIAFDTEILERRPNRPYAGPEKADAQDPAIRFAWLGDLAQQMTFASGSWQHNWILASFLEGKKKKNPRFAGVENLDYRGEPWACYAVLLQSLQEVFEFPTISLTDIYDEDRGVKSHIDVDLILDIGNSRTCGILSEQALDDDVANIGKPAILELRDLSRPELVVTEPFDSRVEFFSASFGKSEFARRSGRPKSRDAFWWPSPIRTGPEAAWLASLSSGREGVSGMSSPKRYVWDKAERPQNWINNRAQLPVDQQLPPIRGRIPAQLTVDGRINEQGMGLEVRYSRRAMYMLLVTELVSHSITQMNSVSHRMLRQNSNLPRRLRKIFVTLPSATPAVERIQIRYQIESAIRLIWKAFEWDLNDRPVPMLEWDEATCAQLVYLYNELEYRFQSFPREFFSIVGKVREGQSSPSLKIASLDIGGGTTDLMVMEHQLHDEIITPVQLFREGFRQAGDDIVKQIIEALILPALVKYAKTQGIENAAQLINRYFGGDSTGISTVDEVRRTLFVNQVLIPAAIRLLQLHEGSDLRSHNQDKSFRLEEILDELSVKEEVLRFIEKTVFKTEDESFSIGNIVLHMETREIAGVIQSVIGRALDDICDVVRAYDCDVLLLTGRPSALPAVKDRIISNVAVPPDRVVPMYGYRVGGWYSFRSDSGQIDDPKTTASVGALLCHLCQGRYASFVFQSEQLQYKSTANYIGKMAPKGLISNHDVFKEEVDSDDPSYSTFKVAMTSKLDIGYRQLPIERWVTSQIYHVSYKDDETARRIPQPVQLTVERRHIEDNSVKKSYFDEEELSTDFNLEEFEVVNIVDAKNNPVSRKDICQRMQTVKSIDKQESGYWLDTGILVTTDLMDDGFHDA